MQLINSKNYLEKTINNLEMLKDAFANDLIPTMLFDGDKEDQIIELQNLINYLTHRKKHHKKP